MDLWASEECQADRVPKAQRDRRVLVELREIRVNQAALDLQVLPVHLVPREGKVVEDRRDLVGHLGHKAMRDREVQLVLLDPKACAVYVVLEVLKVNRA